VRILNGVFDPITLPETVQRASALIKARQRGTICTVNVAILMMMREDPRLQAFVDRAAIVVADGEPLVWTSRVLGQALPERVAGVDLVDELSAEAEREGYGVYLLGAHRSTVDRVAERIRKRHRNIRMCGVADGYFSAAEAGERAKAIADSGAHLLIVGMGVPKQEWFLEEHWEKLGVNVAIGVGGSFDVLAGLRRRAPINVQRVGMEWAFRLAQEPRRLWKRYLATNSTFIYHVSRELLARRTSE
jgi:N-acetylglucosaminyldiphosphoundecaprenol N-acetyl-beta-D-mannosaminyltransferase